jgi:putative acetyltransferase
MRIVPGDLGDSRVVDLLHAHITRARAETAPGSAHALDLSGLQTPDVRLWVLVDADGPLGVGALKRLTALHGEVKSMYIAESRRRSGAGSLMLRHIIAAACTGGMTRLSLETGSWPYFAAARQLYARHGFTVCQPFADYREDPNSVFLTLRLPPSIDASGEA